MTSPAEDPVAQIRADWARIHPEVDTAPVDIVFRVLRAARLLERTSDRNLERFGLSRPELELLLLLRRSSEPISPSAVAEQLLFSAPATTKRVVALEKRGLVLRSDNPHDRRGALLDLTPDGIDLVDRVFPEHVAFDHELLQDLSPAQQQRLVRALTDLVAVLSAGEASGR